MESIGRFCFFNSNGTCNFLRNDPTECNLCPNFVSFKKEALQFSDGSKIPVTYFDLAISRGSGDQFQTSLV
ncbi:MAG: hypothetical protein M1290_02630 [Candidatus Thermoplasmatota archaeon]|jgi:hypothetical protein|nr:hypothetical protein [Candidatus Thermoplasmatota archaeon]MCL5789344.1 hypothetical protein [Candidatus Thermoplasmatota archaeon]